MELDIERDEHSMTALLAFVVGAAAGVALGLLLAPKAGEEMRQNIKDATRDAMDKTRETAEMMQNKARSMMGRGKNAAEEGMDIVREKAKEFRSTAEERTENIVDPFRNRM